MLREGGLSKNYGNYFSPLVLLPLIIKDTVLVLPRIIFAAEHSKEKETGMLEQRSQFNTEFL